MPSKISTNLQKIQSQLASNVSLIAVTKNRPLEQVWDLYNAGYRIFGENRVQDLVEKFELLPKDIQWHLIGHLQTNKVKNIAPFISLIQSVDSLKLLKIIDKEGKKNNRVIPCLLQFFLAKEETKFGFEWAEAIALLDSDEFKTMTNIEIIGIMGMASNTKDDVLIKTEFQQLKSVFEALKQQYFFHKTQFKEISMGMSGDYLIAQAEGSTMVRVGSALFE